MSSRQAEPRLRAGVEPGRDRVRSRDPGPVLDDYDEPEAESDEDYEDEEPEEEPTPPRRRRRSRSRA